MRELREDTFLGNKNNDAYEHVERILDIISLFNIPGVTHDAVMLRVFPISLTGAAKRWGLIPNKTPAKKLDAIQTMADHSQKCHDELKSRRVSSDSSDGIAAITNKLDNLREDMKKLKDNVHVIQVGCENVDEPTCRISKNLLDRVSELH
ncbi:hypothetical protein Tco_0786585 [Tanacetum coccineum]